MFNDLSSVDESSARPVSSSMVTTGNLTVKERETYHQVSLRTNTCKYFNTDASLLQKCILRHDNIINSVLSK